MPELIVWKNERMDKLRKDMDRICTRVCDEFGIPLFLETAAELPAIDVSETEDSIILRAEVPDINPEDLDISITDDTLRIKGETKQEHVEEAGGVQRMERRYGAFSRTLQLPCRIDMDDVKATYKEGILNIVMPKCSPEQAREIKVKVKK
ncbi:MAG: Hsp20/alpha crystallin family protein [Desulfobacteraceae bacterium]|jgi:HSP20 family protein